MAIEEVMGTELLQRCAGCGAVNRVHFDALVVGVACGDCVDEHVVPLPSCPSCSSTEFLIRTSAGVTDHPSSGSFGHLHRVLVDHVHAELVGRRQVIPSLLDAAGEPRKGLCRPPSADAVSRWFKQGLRIEPSEGVESERAAETTDAASRAEGVGDR